MTTSQGQKTTGKTLAVVVLAAIITAIVATLIQRWLLGNASIAVTGGVVGAVTVLAITAMRKKPA